MPLYKVKNGQNIYDVAMTLYGSVEGIFDLLASNKWLNMATRLSSGTMLTYHEEFMVNKDVVDGLAQRGVVVKNGDHTYNFFDVPRFIRQHFRLEHPFKYGEVMEKSAEEQAQFWSAFDTPRAMIGQHGTSSEIRVRVKGEDHLLIDWGDYSLPEAVDGGEEVLLEHSYKGGGRHVITIYGTFELELLDISQAKGECYPLGRIVADTFITPSDNEDLKKLIISNK